MRYGHRTCTILQHLLKRLAPSNVIVHGKAPYQKPRLKSMAHGVYPRIVQCTVPTQREQYSTYNVRMYMYSVWVEGGGTFILLCTYIVCT